MNEDIYKYLLDASRRAEYLMSIKLSEIFNQDIHELINRMFDNMPREASNLKSYLQQLPVLTFNGAMYDINLNKKHGLLSLMVNDDGGIIFSAKKANRYMAIATNNIKMLDMCNYLAAGTSYEQYVKAFGCTLQKGFFPYEWMDNVDKLNATSLPPIEAFYSNLKSCNSLITEDDPTGKKNYTMLLQIWNSLGMRTMRDFLEWYNNLDVIPFIEAIDKQKEYYKKYELDMFKDAVSIPGLAEKIMFLEARDCDLSIPEKHKYAEVSPQMIQQRINGYKEQDLKAEREWVEDEYLDIAKAKELLEESNYRCHYCWLNVGNTKCKNEKFALSFDRVDCSKAHLKDNLKVSCLNCNTSRSDIPYDRYYDMTEIKRIDHVNPQIRLISEENKEVFYKLKENVVGGASIIFHRYHEANKTYIKRPHYDEEKKTWSDGVNNKKVKKIVGFDANALYLWALSQEMPCGKLALVSELPTIEDIINERFFGFVEVDIETPSRLYNKFGEFPPIFHNTEIKEEQLGDYMRELRATLKNPIGEDKKLISSFAAKKILLYTPLLKWYLQAGLEITHIHSAIKATKNNVFKSFTEGVSAARREGDKDKSKAILADSSKLVGNSAFGRTGMDKSKHTSTIYTKDIYKAKKKVNNWLFRDLNEIELVGAPQMAAERESNTLFEVRSGKRSIKQNCPIQVASAVYQLAKLRMLQFYYDCLDKFLDRSDFQYVEMDTDSAYMAITGDRIEDLVKPDMKATFEKEQYEWFPDNRTKETAALDKRKPGLFKVEWEGQAIVALTSKMYYCHGGDMNKKSKSSAKGIQMRNNADLLTFENYKSALIDKKILQAHNKGFRARDNGVVTYEQSKNGLSPIYDKRVVLEDGITTIPIM